MHQEGFEQAKQDYINSSRLIAQALQNTMRAFIEAMAKAQPSWERLNNYLPDDSFSGEPFIVLQARLIALVEQQERFWEDFFQRLSATSTPDEFVAEQKAILSELEEAKRDFGGD